jgi:UDP-3-O-[3-hydroxymyristoyl] glucosamine N-acyltransferase
MADSRFFTNHGPFSLGELAEMTGARLADPDHASRMIADVGALDAAGGDQLIFLENRRYANLLADSGAGACLLAEGFADRAPDGMAILLTDRPRRNFARVARAFYPDAALTPGAHASAVIDATATVADGCQIDAMAVIGANAEIGADCHIANGAVIGAGVQIGSASVVGAGASLSHCLIGDRVVIYPGARIGQPGFGFETDSAGLVKMPQLGRVIIEDDVEIGANSTVDRGSGPDTVIGRGTMIDNLVQIGHNVVIGKGCIIVAMVGIAGSTTLGDYVVLAGQVGVAGHLTIGSGAQVAAQSGITGNIEPGAKMGGSPAVLASKWRRQVAAVKRLGERGGGSSLTSKKTDDEQ